MFFSDFEPRYGIFISSRILIPFFLVDNMTDGVAPDPGIGTELLRFFGLMYSALEASLSKLQLYPVLLVN
jgi:hypothetical protein